jgi:V/A-type H+-transporting ATPase subunit I
MAIAGVQRVEIVAPSGFKMDLLSSLQEEGLVQINSIDCEELGLSGNGVDLSALDHRLHRISSALDYLDDFEEKKLSEKLFAPKPQLDKKKRKEALDWDYPAILEQIERLQADRNDIVSHIKYLDREDEFLRPLFDLNLAVKSIKSTERMNITIGFLPSSRLEELERLAEEEPLWFSIIHRDKRNAFVILFVAKSEQDRIEQSLKEIHFAPQYFTEPILGKADEDDCVKDILDKNAKERARKGREIGSIDNEARRLSVHRDKLMQVHDVLVNEREKRHSARLLGETERVFYLDGWIRAEDKNRLLTELEPFSDYLECYFRPPGPEEEPPVILQNPKPGRPFELITKLYGLPQLGSLDPTLFLMPFFFIFVGIAVGEAGYGLLVTLLCLFFLKKAKPKGSFRLFLILLAALGVSNIIFGTLVGGWFGFPFRRLMLLDPLEDPVSFLILALALGFVQVWFGTFLMLITLFKKKDYLQALCVQGGWLILLPSLVLYGVTKNSLAGILALVGAGGIVVFAAPSRNPIARFFGGLYSLYDISRYLADVLSYSRLLALGLATSVIAMVVNTLCQTALAIPGVGWLFAGLIFLGGHLFNLAISFLGGFVHSMRLQFVEFFSKFFTAGGKPFKPLELEAKYVDFV